MKPFYNFFDGNIPFFKGINVLVSERLKDPENPDNIGCWTQALKVMSEHIEKKIINNQNAHIQAKANDFNSNISPIIIELIKIFLIHSEYFAAARYKAIATCEELLINSIEDNDLTLKLLYILANLHSYSGNYWRREPYKTKFDELKRNLQIGNNFPEMQRDNEEAHNGLRRLLHYLEHGEIAPSRYIAKTGRRPDSYKLNTFDLDLDIEDRKIGSLQLKPNEVEEEVENSDKQNVENLRQWNGIQEFAVLTGVNGIGKTKILDSINEELKRRYFNKDFELVEASLVSEDISNLEILNSNQQSIEYHLYADSESDILRNVFGKMGNDFKPKYVYEKLVFYLDFKDYKKRESVTKRAEESLSCKIALAIADKIFCERKINAGNWRDIIRGLEDQLSTKEEKIQFLENFISNKDLLQIAEKLAFKLNAIKEPISFVKNICWQHLQLIKKTHDPTPEIQNNNDYDQECSDHCENNLGIIPAVKNINILLQKYLKDFEVKYEWVPYFKYRLLYNSYELPDSSEIGFCLDENDDLQCKIANKATLLPISRDEEFGIENYDDIKKALMQNRYINLDDKINQITTYTSQRDYTPGNYELIFYKSEKGIKQEVHTQNLSSGELVLIKLILWVYVSKGLDFNQRKHEVNSVKQYIAAKEAKKVFEENNYDAFNPLIENSILYFTMGETNYKILIDLLDIEIINNISQSSTSNETKDPDNFCPTTAEKKQLFKKIITVLFPSIKLNLLLLDEVDKHFDPKFSNILMDILRHELIHENGKVQTIMTTHRLDTIALTDDQNLFVIEKKINSEHQILLENTSSNQQDSTESIEVKTIMQVKPCNKLLAIAKLARNMQKFLGMHIKVYTEAPKDAMFYESIYANMMKYSTIIRNKKIHREEGSDPFLAEIATLSRRYQMGFYSVSLENGVSGGYKQVNEMIKRSSHTSNIDEYSEMYSSTDSFVASLFRKYQVDAPFGIVDHDYEERREPACMYEIVRATRHSLENFIFDPIIICSLFDTTELNNMHSSNSEEDSLKDTLKQLSETLRLTVLSEEQIQTLLKEIFKNIFKVYLNSQIKCENADQFLKKINVKYKGQEISLSLKIIALAYQDLEKESNIMGLRIKKSNKIVDDVQDFMSILSEDIKDEIKNKFGLTKKSDINNLFNEIKKNSYKPDKDLKLKVQEDSGEISEIENAMAIEIASRGQYEVLFSEQNIKKIDILLKGKIFHLEYPKVFLTARGHNYEYALSRCFAPLVDLDYTNPKIKIIGRLINHIASKSINGLDGELNSDANIFALPLDLMGMIINLNGKIKSQVISKADENKYKLYASNSELARQKGYVFKDNSEVNVVTIFDNTISTNQRADEIIEEESINPISISNKGNSNQELNYKNTKIELISAAKKIKRKDKAIQIANIIEEDLVQYLMSQWSLEKKHIKFYREGELLYLTINKEVKNILDSLSLDTFNLKKIEKILLFYKKIDLVQYLVKTTNVKDEPDLSKECLNKKLQLTPTINVISEPSHSLDHKSNIEKLISMLNDGMVCSTIICLERKQHGTYLGMPDVIALANYIEHGSSSLQAELQQLPIYHDALLYNAAKTRGIAVTGIEGKGLLYPKESSYYHQAREEYMAKRLLDIAQSGKNAIFLVGSAHINNLVKLLVEQGFCLDTNNEHSADKNLITLNFQYSTYTLPENQWLGLLPESSSIVDQITNSNLLLESASFVGIPQQANQFYEILLSYFDKFVEQTDLNWQVKKLLYFKDVWKYNVIQEKYGLAKTIDVFKESDSSFRKSVLLKLHPDKNFGNNDCTDDFAFVINLKEKLEQPLSIKTIVNQNIQTVQYIIHQATIGLKALDIVIDTTKLINDPTLDNTKKLALDSAYVYSMCYSINYYSLIINTADILYKSYQGEYNQAFDQLSTALSYMAIPTMLAYTGIPYLGFVYGSFMAGYTGYHTVNNAYSLYLEYGTVEWQLKSATAYKNLYEALANSPLQYTYDFASNAKNYEVKANTIKLEIEKVQIKQQLETKGEFGNKLYNYVYLPLLEEKYTLLKKIINEELTKEQTEVLKAKHVAITIEEQSYEHCMEVVKLKDIKIDHYYCYNEEQQILDQILIGENGRYIEVIERL